jgi:hypothetical protein
VGRLTCAPGRSRGDGPLSATCRHWHCPPLRAISEPRPDRLRCLVVHRFRCAEGSTTAKLPTSIGTPCHLLWRSNRLFVGNKALFCRFKSLFWRITGKPLSDAGKWRKTPALSVLRSCSWLLIPCSAVRNEGFSLLFLFEQGSGPSIALAETGSGKLALFGGN